MSDEDRERQENELLALESIYSEKQFIRSTEGNGGQLSVSIEVPPGFKVVLKVDVDEKETLDQTVPDNNASNVEVKTINNLPPFILNFMFPEDYPSQSPPSYTLSCKWLNVVHLTKLCKLLDDTWKDQGAEGEILFEWVQVFGEDIFTILNIPLPLQLTMVPFKYRRQSSAYSRQSSIEVDSRAHQDISSVESLMTYIVDYDAKETENHFQVSYFNCGVCFCEKLGKDCIAFPKCGHVYCTECMTEYFKIQIAGGSVRALTCPEDKCNTQADPGLVKRLVPDDMFERYDRFLLQSTLDCMSEIVYCPRPSCQSPVLKESAEHDEKSTPLARCASCNFVFCALCKRSYHGVAMCPIPPKELFKLRLDYLNGSADTRSALEKRYGKKKLQQAVEEHFSETWLGVYSKKCPTCKSNIQKIDGCNKMSCFQCKNSFCWLCGKGLSSANPYDHFNNEKNGCFNKLFVGVDDDSDSDSDDEDWEDLLPH